MSDIVNNLDNYNRKKLFELAKNHGIKNYNKMKNDEIRKSIRSILSLNEDNDKNYNKKYDDEIYEDNDLKVKIVNSKQIGNLFNDISSFD